MKIHTVTLSNERETRLVVPCVGCRSHMMYQDNDEGFGKGYRVKVGAQVDRNAS